MFRRNAGLLRVKNTQPPVVVVKQVVESILFLITYYVVHSFLSCPYLKFIDVQSENYIRFLSFHGTREAFNLLSSTSSCILHIFNIQKIILKKI